jgi:hypothetical protein
MVMKKSSRGSVGRALKRREKRQEEEFKKKELEIRRIYNKKNREKIRKYNKNWDKKLSEFSDKRCKKCNRLLHWRTKGDYCREHIWIGRKK